MPLFLSLIKSTIMSIRNSIKNFLNNIWDLFHQWFDMAEQVIKDNVHIAVVITENVKRFIDNPVGDFLLSVIDDKIPGNVSEKVKEILPRVLVGLRIIDNCKDLDEEETLKCIAANLNALSKDLKDIVYHNLAITLAKELSDGQFSISDVIALVEWYYRTRVKEKN